MCGVLEVKWIHLLLGLPDEPRAVVELRIFDTLPMCFSAYLRAQRERWARRRNADLHNYKKNEKLLKTSRQTGLEVQTGTTRIWEVEARGSWVQGSPELCFEVSSKNEIQQA